MISRSWSSDFKKAIKERTGKDFPEDAHEQMWAPSARSSARG